MVATCLVSASFSSSYNVVFDPQCASLTSSSSLPWSFEVVIQTVTVAVLKSSCCCTTIIYVWHAATDQHQVTATVYHPPMLMFTL